MAQENTETTQLENIELKFYIVKYFAQNPEGKISSIRHSVEREVSRQRGAKDITEAQVKAVLEDLVSENALAFNSQRGVYTYPSL